LGYLGAVSKEYAEKAFPILERALAEVPSQTKTVLESFERMTQVTDKKINKKILEYATRYVNDPKPSIKAKAIKIQKFLSEMLEED
jgi:hypothetical protein